MSTELEEMGPIDYMVIEFPGGHMGGTSLPLLVDLVNRGTIRILDLAFIRKLPDGSVVRIDVSSDTGNGERGIDVFAGAASGLLGADDLDEAAAAIGAGSMAGIIIYENRWAAPLAIALRRGGARLVATDRIPVQAILASLDAAELAS
jgi:hypothetical protein